MLEALMDPLLAAIAAYGTKVFGTVEDEAADATVRLGQRLLGRLRRERPALEAAVADVAENPGDPDFEAALRGQVKKSLKDPDLAAELDEMLKAAGVAVSASGEGSVAVQNNSGIVSTGSHAKNTIGRE